MEPLTILLTLALIVLTSLIVYKLTGNRRRFVSTVNKIPGPPYTMFVGNTDILVPRNQFMKVVNSHAEKYRPIFRTWAGPSAEIHLLKPEYIEKIVNNITHIEKSWMYSFLYPWLGQGLLTSSGSKWHKHRKMITPTFHFSILEQFFDVFVEQSHVMVGKLEQEAVRRADGFDVCPFITRCTLDIICQTAMGTDIHAQDDTKSEYATAVQDISMLTLMRIMRPWLHPDCIFHLSSLGQQYNKCLEVVHGFTAKVIRERKAKRRAVKPDLREDMFGRKQRLAFLDLLLEASQGDDELTDVEIREEVDTFMFEGHDTTTAGITWALFMIALHPDVQDKVIAEQDEIFQGSDRPITMRDVQEMKYLERVIKETLRLYPSVPFIMRNLNGDTEIGGYMLPAGCIINIHIYHVHRDPQHWGDDPLRFDPDNFLPDRVQGRHPYAYIPFSAGPRNCIGQKFALLEEKTLLAAIMRTFRLEAVERREDVVEIGELILKTEGGIKLRMTRR